MVWSWQGAVLFRTGLICVLLLAGSRPGTAAPQLPCAAGAITCVELAPTGEQTQPVTFGQVFKAGEVPSQSQLAAADGEGAALPLQIDQAATYPDGSLRFAVLSTVLSRGDGGQPRLINLMRRAPAASTPVAAAPPKFDLDIALTTHLYQATIVKFGNRTGHTPGTPFQAGETITLNVAGETFSLTVVKGMTTGDFNSYQAIAQAFVKLVNERSQKVTASWSGAEAGSEENLLLTAKSDQPFTVAVDYKGAARIALLVHRKPGPAESWTAHLGSDQGAFWLNGPVAVERDIAIPLRSAVTGKPHPLLSLRVRLRRYLAAPAMRADIVFANDWAYAPGPGNVIYDVAIRRNGETVFSRKALVHTHHARWHMVVWSEGRQEPVVRYDIPHFVDSGLVPHYDASLRISPGALADIGRDLQDADRGPMGMGTVTPQMLSTGMRSDLGPLPQWAALYLLSMDPRPRTMTFINADAGAGMPIHYRDQATGLPVSLDRHPGLAMQFGRPSPADAFPAVEMRTNPWTVDVAHLPALAYVPYLVSGDLFYLEEVMAWANWVMGCVDPALRGMDKGLLWANQVRGTAWAIRSLGHAAIILPDAHPMKRYFNAKLQNNLEYYLSRFVRSKSPNVSPLGILENVDQKGVIGPWQYDFLFLSIADLARAKIPNAEELMRWMARFVVGRWSAETDGYCYRMAPAYYVKFRDPSGRPFSDWGALFRANWPDMRSCPPAFPQDSGAGSPDGYVANSYAALGAAAAFSIPGAEEIRRRIARDSPAMLARFGNNPTFAIVP
jgi:hypothetical protein